MELAIADAYYAGIIVYPEQFAGVDFNQKAEEIFKTMVGMEYLKVLDDAGIGFGPIKIGQ
jgi:iron complex transport system substrate-binding protein